MILALMHGWFGRSPPETMSAGQRIVSREEVGVKSTRLHSSAEVVLDENDRFLWMDRYTLQRLHRPGECFIHDSREYQVISHTIVQNGDLGLIVMRCRPIEGRF